MDEGLDSNAMLAAVLGLADPWQAVSVGFCRAAGRRHGLLVLAASADVLQKVTDGYSPETESSLAWDDPELATDWPLDPGQVPTLSARNARWPRDGVLRSPS